VLIQISTLSFNSFCSLHQKDKNGYRNENEGALFGRALKSLDQLYSHPFTWIIKATSLPDHYPKGFVFPDRFPDGTKCTPNRAAYYERGWCFCESSMGNLVKNSVQVLDLAHFSGLSQDAMGILHECSMNGGRRPPLPPTQFATELEDKSFTSKKADCEYVAGMYERAFNMRVGEAKHLNYAMLGWGDVEMETFCRVLRTAASCELLILSENQIGESGVVALAAGLRDSPAPLQRIYLDGNHFGDEGLVAIDTALRAGALPHLKKLSVKDNPHLTRACIEQLQGAREGLEVDYDRALV
jgi:hypothetical protein